MKKPKQRLMIPYFKWVCGGCGSYKYGKLKRLYRLNGHVVLQYREKIPRCTNKHCKSISEGIPKTERKRKPRV